jgi:hypothetical protein
MSSDTAIRKIVLGNRPYHAPKTDQHFTEFGELKPRLAGSLGRCARITASLRARSEIRATSDVHSFQTAL